MCVGCHAQIRETEDREVARTKGKKVSSYCSDCKQYLFHCLECFFILNKNYLIVGFQVWNIIIY